MILAMKITLFYLDKAIFDYFIPSFGAGLLLFLIGLAIFINTKGDLSNVKQDARGKVWIVPVLKQNNQDSNAREDSFTVQVKVTPTN